MKHDLMDSLQFRRPSFGEWARRRSYVVPSAIAFAVLFVLVVFSGGLFGSHADKPAMHGSVGSRDAALDNVRNATLGFEKIFVIAMASRYDRRDALALAAANTGMDINFFDGIRGDDIAEKTLPPHDVPNAGLNAGTLGAWRTHANILREIVQKNITTAFIMESDADWDVRIKDQLYDYAKSTRALIQPVSGTKNKFFDGTYPIPPPATQDEPQQPLLFGKLPKTALPMVSPYGDGWDILHIGHCGMRSPLLEVPQEWHEAAKHVPKGHVVHYDDPTVPEPHYLHSFNDERIQPFRTVRPGINHTRIVHHSMNFVCSHGFGISQAGARRLLHYVAMRKLDGPFDAMMERYCQDPKLLGRRGPCLATQPPLMGQHRPAGDITKDFEINSPWFDGISGTRDKGFTDNIRHSAQENIVNIIYGDEIEDLWPDTARSHKGSGR